jgi:hypothetical protein
MYTSIHLATVTALAGISPGVVLADDRDSAAQNSDQLVEVVATASHIKRAEVETNYGSAGILTQQNVASVDLVDLAGE